MGVAKNASQDEIKKSYRKLARKFHPDVSKEKDAEQRFKDIGEAYEVLRDKDKRASYDQLGSNWKAGQSGFTPPPNWQEQFHQSGSQGAGGNEQYSDFFESLFGGGGFQQRGQQSRGGYQSQRSMRGQDSNAKINIDLEDSYTGASRSFTLSGQEANERGQMQNTARTLKVKIPKGIKAGQKIRLQKQGEAGFGGEKGDLYLEIAFNVSPQYVVDGANVTYELSVAPWQAALGEKVKVQTPTGEVDLTLPKGINSGSKMRIKGRGIPAKVAGDFFVKIKIVFPSKLSDEEVELYQSLKALTVETSSEKESA